MLKNTKTETGMETKGSLLNDLKQILKSNKLTSSAVEGGRYVQKLEKLFCSFTGARYAVAVNSGTSALMAVLFVLGLKNKRIAHPNLTFKATRNAIMATGNIPVAIDVLKQNMTISPKIKNVDCIIPVHLYGHVAMLEDLNDLNIPLVEDCCQSLGSRLNNKHTGLFGVAGCFSFYPSKVVSAGEGGMIITDNKSLADKLRLFRNHGDLDWGLNLRLPEINAAIAVHQMHEIKSLLKLRKQNAESWKDLLGDSVSYYEPRTGETRNNQLLTVTTASRKALMRKYLQARIYYDYTLGAGRNGKWFSRHALSFPTKCL